MSIFSDRLRLVRQQKGLTQEQIALLIGAKVKQSYQQYEGGTRTPSVETAAKIADALDVSLDYLTGRTDNPKVNK